VLMLESAKPWDDNLHRAFESSEQGRVVYSLEYK